eukprot:Gb_39213 [translate_table: standard]
MAPKRTLESDDDATGLPEEKRPRVPAFQSVIAEAMRMHTVHKFCSALEPLLRRVVNEEVERALARFVPAKLRPSTKQIQGVESKGWRLQFKNKLSLPLFTGSRVEGEQNCPIQIELVDASTGQKITSGPESSMKVEIIVLEGDFGPDEEEDWTREDFDNHVVREREGKRPLLTGDLVISLKEGSGTLGELTFTDNSSWIRSRKFRLGARVPVGSYDRIRIREAKTEAFTVKDHRGELYKKHYPPALHDEVWRLDKVGKDGAFHKRLSSAGVYTVQDFLRLVVMDPQRLRQILGNGMSNKMWEGTVVHARTCVLYNKFYVHYADGQHNIGVIFNIICELVGLIAEGQTIPVCELSETQKSFVEKLVKHAYEHWNEVIEYDGGSLFGNASHSLTRLNTYIEAPNDIQGPRGSSFQRTALLEEQDGRGPQLDTKSQMMGGRFLNHHQSAEEVNTNWLHAGDSLNAAASNQAVVGTGFAQQNIGPQAVQSSSLTLAPRHVLMAPLSLPYQTQNLNTHTQRNGMRNESFERNDFKNIFPEKGIRDLYGERSIVRNDWIREPHEGPNGLYRIKSSNELASELENRGSDGEDFQFQMQNWIRVLNPGPGEQAYNFFPNSQGDHGFTFTSLPPTSDSNFNLAGSRLHGKAYVGWLKLKAALKWGISVRKVVAARRAKLDELED